MDGLFAPARQCVNLGKIACERCHGDHAKSDKLRGYEENRLTGYSRDIVWRGRGGMKMSDCEHCHDDKGVVTSCVDCHK